LANVDRSAAACHARDQVRPWTAVLCRGAATCVAAIRGAVRYRSSMRSMILVAVFCAVAQAQPKDKPDPDTRAIRQAALDYIEGWYEGDVARMSRAVHPELVKRIVVTENGASRIDGMGASRLVANVRNGGGKKTPKDKQQKDVTILDRFENTASVKIVASDWIDYLHIAKVDGQWRIVNVLWELKPAKK
jgi:hypothetical protein